MKTTTTADEAVLTSAEVRRMLRIGSSTLQKYRDDGLLRFSRVNKRRFLYTEASVRALLPEPGAPVRRTNPSGRATRGKGRAA